MVDFEEEDFPRGGTRARAPTKRPKQDDNLFSINVQKKSKKRRKEKKTDKENVTEDSFHSSLKIQGTLSYNSIRTDMIILGCIRNITKFSLEVELPGLTFGYVSITNISDPFTKYLNSILEESNEESDTFLTKMFKVGQFVLTKVTNIENNKTGVRVECTINPREIYSDKYHSSFEKGLLIWASVKAQLEHGYEMNVGVKNCRVFLPSKNIDKDRSLIIGEPIWCTIHKSDNSSAASIIRVSCKSEHIKNTKIEGTKNLHDLIPGMQVEMVIEKITANGVQGKFLNDFFGHIDEGQLNKKLSKYQEGNLLTAYVLYIDHTVKVTYLTTYDLDLVTSPKYKIGDTVIAEVVSKAFNGIYFKLPSKETCLITNKRLILSLPKQYANMDISDTIRLKYPPGTRHSCRILDYNHLSRFYIGTVEQSLIKEKLFKNSDITIGQLLDVTVEDVKSDGLVVTAGHIRGFVPNLYLSNIKYSDRIKKKFKEGLHIKARVLNVDNDNILLTLKSGQVESDQCLTELSQAKRGDRYPGVIVQTKPKGALVVFYGNVKGWLSKKHLDEEEDHQKPNPELFFYVGQVVNPWVLAINNDKVILSLRQPRDFDTFGSLTIGQKISGVVSSIRRDKLFVKTLRGRPIGTIPVNHLSRSLRLCRTLLKTYSVGDKLDDLICVDNTVTPNILSRREALALKTTPHIRIKKFHKVKEGNIIRCSYLSVDNLGIYVRPFISDYTETVLIRHKDIVNKGGDIPNFELFQSIVAKVIEVQHDSRKIRLTAKLSQVFDNSVESFADFFGQCLSDFQTICKFGKENNWDICQYQPGERVTCNVQKLGDQGGCLVTLPNGINGLVPPRLCPENVKERDVLTGVFLSQNFVENYAEICLRSDICCRINNDQDLGILKADISSCIAENIIIKSDFIIALPKQKEFNRQLVYIPLVVHENDFEGCGRYYEKDKLKICICGKVDNRLIGMSKRQFLSLDKHKEAISKAKALRTEKKEEISPSSSQESSVANTEENSETTDKNQNFIASTQNEDYDIEVRKETSTNDSTLDDDDIEMDEDETDNEEQEELINSKSINVSTVESISEPQPVISGVNSFFNTNSDEDQEVSSDDEVEETIVKKKKKLTPAERAQIAKEEENRISKIEKDLADPTKAPESAEQFDRALLASPNSSELWTKYMAFHMSATEFDKARVVAKRALESINVTLSAERLNIWIALLNLENLLGTKESFEKTFKDAINYNDSLQVYLHTIQILAESGKLDDMEEKINAVRHKFKHEPKMWLSIANTYYQLDKFKEARNIKDAALKSISNKQTQLEIIVQFAIMEFKSGDPDYGAAIFETILSSYPKKVTVWTTYVDQLVKKGKIQEARQVLERSVGQQLNLKNAKTLFLKYRMFEEQHGTPEMVEQVKEKAKEFVSKVK